MNNFKNFKKFWEKEEPEIITTSNLGETGIHRLLQRPMTFEYDKIDLEMIEQQWGKDFKQEMIDAVLMGDYKKEMKMNRVELEMQRLRESTGGNYMLNKMINTDGVNFFAEYTLYKDYDKYFGLTLDGESIDVIDIMEEEFAEFLSHYRLSAMYPQVEAVHEDSWHITPEENETIKEQMESGQTDKFTPVYGDNDIDKQLVVDSKYDMSTDSFSESYLKGPEMWTETPTNTGEGCEESWTETSTNTGSYVEPWGSYRFSESGTISIDPEAFYIDEKQLKGLSITQHLKNIQDGYVLISDIENKSDQEKLAESVKFIESLLAQEEQVEIKDSPTTLKNTENKSGAELITKIISDIIKELFTEGTCSINITLK